jgi:hypothetical protein
MSAAEAAFNAKPEAIPARVNARTVFFILRST